MKRIDKRVARRLYNEGKKILVVPCKCHPAFGFDITNHDDDFDRLCNEIEYYNCGSEVGAYLAFYIDEDELE